jgi:hypothetical protein
VKHSRKPQLCRPPVAPSIVDPIGHSSTQLLCYWTPRYVPRPVRLVGIQPPRRRQRRIDCCGTPFESSVEAGAGERPVPFVVICGGRVAQPHYIRKTSSAGMRGMMMSSRKGELTAMGPTADWSAGHRGTTPEAPVRVELK